MSLYALLLVLHLLGASVWAGGHLVLALSVLPPAWRRRTAQPILAFEGAFERIGLPALAVQVVTGLALAYVRLGPPAAWFSATPLAHAVQLKLALLAATVALAVHARLRLIPRLTNQQVPALGGHIIAVTVLALLFVVAGVALRLGGIG